LGIKSGRGFYSYQNKKGRAEDDPTLDKFTEAYRQKPGRKISRSLTT